MPIITPRGQWKSVEVPGDLAAGDKNFAFLCGFEEISAEDYRAGKETAKPKKGKKGAKSEDKNGKKKKKMSQDLPSSDDDDDVEDQQDETMKEHTVASKGEEKPAKKRRAKKPKAKKKATAKAPVVDSIPVLTQAVASNSTANRKRKISVESETSEGSVSSEAVDSSSLDIDMSAWIDLYLPNEIMKALTDLKFTEPTAIQRLVCPAAIRDKLDILGAAETGSGKTLAFGIPIVARLLESVPDSKCLRALVLAPTRELAVQVKNHITTLIKYTDLKITSIVGGLSQQKQERLIKTRPDILVATPGRLWALMDNADPSSYLGDLSQLQCLVIDETDRMVEKGHFEELTYILDRIQSQAPEKKQTMVFSATLTYVHPAPKRLNSQQSQQMTPEEKIERLIEIANLRKQRKVFDLTRSFGTAETLIETRLNCDGLAEKDSNVYYLLTRHPGRTLIFTNSVDAARRLHGLLVCLNINPQPMVLHAKMHQKQRLKNLERFAETPNSVLLATDVAARGLDIRGIEHVIHYQVPKTAEVYVHRSGRTGRAAHQGLTVLLVDPQDAQFYRRICRNLNREKDLPIFPIDSPNLMNALKARMALATEVESLDHRMHKVTSRETWFERSAREADLHMDDVDRLVGS
uniref:ATP-dependent RNA helicase n=1 Tax=Plectus sambesii TaxID=2011161 RepID=A0A914VRU8_9BILA